MRIQSLETSFPLETNVCVDGQLNLTFLEFPPTLYLCVLFPLFVSSSSVHNIAIPRQLFTSLTVFKN